MNINLIIAVVLSLVSVYIIYLVKKKTGKFAYSVLTALALGLLLGFVFKENVGFMKIVGSAYMSLIKMIVVPLVMVSLITSIIRLENIKTLRTIGLKTIIVLLGTTGIASFIGVVVANILKLGKGLNFVMPEGFEVREVPEFSKVLLDMLPSNPVASIVDGKIIPIIIFSLFIAVALMLEDNKNPKLVKPFKDFLMATYGVVSRITQIILVFIPYGVFALIANAAASNGLDTIKSLLLVVVAVYVACIIQILVVHTSLITFVARKNPIEFFKAISPAQILAFTSQSSYGTLPVTIKSLTERAGVSENIASFVAPLGATIGMNGCGGVYPAIVAVFVSNLFGIEMSMYSYIMIIFTAIISSIGIAGVPGSATMSTTVVLSTLGLPIEGMAMVMSVDAINDMMRTMTNITGTSVAAVVVDEMEKRKKD